MGCSGCWRMEGVVLEGNKRMKGVSRSLLSKSNWPRVPAVVDVTSRRSICLERKEN